MLQCVLVGPQDCLVLRGVQLQARRLVHLCGEVRRALEVSCDRLMENLVRALHFYRAQVFRLLRRGFFDCCGLYELLVPGDPLRGLCRDDLWSLLPSVVALGSFALGFFLALV